MGAAAVFVGDLLGLPKFPAGRVDDDRPAAAEWRRMLNERHGAESRSG